MDRHPPRADLRALADQPTVRLTTFRRDGTPVATPVNLAVDGERGYFRTWDTSGKAKRLRRDRHVEVAPCTFLGRPTGPAVAGRAVPVDGATAERARHLIEGKHPILQGLLVHHGHRLTGRRAIYYELVPAERTLCADSPRVWPGHRPAGPNDGTASRRM